ncbi:hypothetical protein FKV70_24425 [Paenibacillus ottowii]|uniref:Uncharacterized protein n=1 Tax=Paenibacillus ottowii TaxID=2315729 RepID=A0ABY3B279_9BACL|nr:hypothetical protein FKV70_24425 [Paenibacillus ottowii]
MIILAIVCGLLLNSSKQNPIPLDQQTSTPHSKKYSGEKYVARYSYKRVDDQKAVLMTSNILHATSLEEESSAQFRGALITLFGQPQRTSKDLEEAYGYIIKATNSTGQSWILTAYEGPGGPAIGGDTEKDSITEVAQDLLNLIEATKPANFEAEGYYEDTGSTIRYGCKNQVCYYRESTTEQHATWE